MAAAGSYSSMTHPWLIRDPKARPSTRKVTMIEAAVACMKEEGSKNSTMAPNYMVFFGNNSAIKKLIILFCVTHFSDNFA